MNISRIKHKINKNGGILLRNSVYYIFKRSEFNVIFRNLLSIYEKILLLIPLVPYKTISHSKYLENQPKSYGQLLLKRDVGYTSNLVFDLQNNELTLIPVKIHDIFLYKHENVRIHGNSDFVLDVSNGMAISDAAYEMDDRIELFDGALFNHKKDLVLLKYDNTRCDSHLESGIMISGRFSDNYYHILYELLIKLILLDNVNIPETIPIVVDKVVTKVKSFKFIFEALNRTNRPIVFIDKEEVISFDKLFCISAINTIPPHYRDVNGVQYSEDFIFDVNLLQVLKDRLIVKKSKKEFPSRIFVTRKNTKQRNFNEDEIIDFLEQYDFVIVKPEEYDLADQIAMFNNAKIIIGGSGAAMANLLFCNKGCKVICFKSNKKNTPAFTTIAYSQGVDMRYFIGSPIKSSIGKSYLHVDYHINVKDLKNVVDKIINLL